MSYQPPTNDHLQNLGKQDGDPEPAYPRSNADPLEPSPYDSPSQLPYLPPPPQLYAGTPASSSDASSSLQLAQQHSVPRGASQLAATHQLGTVLREYKNDASTAMSSGIALSVLGAALLLLLVTLVVPGRYFGLVWAALLGIPLLVNGVSRIRIAMRNQDAQLYLCAQGVMRVKAGQVEALRWDQIIAVQKILIAFRSSYSLNRYMLYQADGMPLELDRSFLGFEEFGTRIEREVTQRLLPQAIAAYQAGNILNFGIVDVTPLGLSLEGGQKTLPWEELGDARVNKQFITITKRGMPSAWENLSISEMPNFCIFLPLVSHIKKGSKEKRPMSYRPPTNDYPPNSEWQEYE